MTTRIVFLVPDLETSGDLTELHSLLSGLPEEQYDLHGLSFSPGGRSSQLPAPIADQWTTITRRTQTDLAAWWQFRKYLRRLEPHIIHLWQPLDFSWITLLADLLHRGTIAISLRDPFPRLVHHPDLATQLLCKRPYQFITTTAYLKNQLVQRGMAASQCAVIPAAVPICPSDPGNSRLLSELGLPAGSRLIGSLNQMQSWKQIQDLIWITAVLKVATDDIHLVMNGHGPYQRRLQRFAKQVEIQQHVHWIDPLHQLTQWLPAVHCYASTTQHVGHSVGILHAMSTSLPIAAIDCPGNRELIVPGKHGLLVPSGDSGSMARAVWKILGDPELARRMGQQGREHIEQFSTTTKMVQAHHEIYQSLPIGRPLTAAST